MDTNDYIREDVASIRRLASGDPDARQIYDKLADDMLVRHAANAMQEKLQLARVKGRGGWWNSDECTIEHLRTLLREHVEKGDMRDVLNLAAMVYVREIADMRPNKWSPAALVHELFTAAQLAPGEGIENAVGRLAALVEAQQPAKAKSPRQILTAPENLPNQYGVEFGMSGQQMHFKIGHQLFRLAYKPDDQQEFEFMKRMLIHAFSTFTPDVKMAQHPTTHVQNPAEIEHVAGDVSKNGAESDVAQRPAPSAAADLIAALEEARRAINSMKVEAETAAQGDEQMMLEACETISNEGLQADMAIRAALASAPKPSPTPQADSQPALPKITAEDRSFLHYNPNTGDVVEWVQNYARCCIDADRAARAAQPLPAGEYPPLPRKAGLDDHSILPEPGFSADQMHAYVDADRAMRAQAAPRPAVQQGDCPTMDDAIAAGDGTLHGAIDHWRRRALDAERVLLSRSLVLEEAAKACEERERRAIREAVRATCRLCAKDIRSLAVVNQSLTTGPTANPEAPVAQADSQPAPARDYPPLPDFETVEQHIYGACRRYITQDMLEPIHNLIRDVIDADRAAKEGDPQ